MPFRSLLIPLHFAPLQPRKIAGVACAIEYRAKSTRDALTGDDDDGEAGKRSARILFQRRVPFDNGMRPPRACEGHVVLIATRGAKSHRNELANAYCLRLLIGDMFVIHRGGTLMATIRMGVFLLASSDYSIKHRKLISTLAHPASPMEIYTIVYGVWVFQPHAIIVGYKWGFCGSYTLNTHTRYGLVLLILYEDFGWWLSIIAPRIALVSTKTA